ncbi:MAG TPA: hypothetical protein VLQ91_15230 [Draconibacterium sp.]|nr:hypothetical protein [Draconibacterium sp.]
MKTTIAFFLIILFAGCASQQKLTNEKEIITTTPEQINTKLEIEFIKGKYHNHPSFAIWIEDLDGNYIETLYVTQYFAKGVFGHGEAEPGKWKNEPGEVRRPAALPYWSHKRNIKAADGLYAPSSETAVPDALTGATPKGNFTLSTGSKVSGNKSFRVLFEINQPWDSNDFWNNNKFPENLNYNTSLQPALVYEAVITPSSPKSEYYLNPIGHSHPSGETGELFTDLSTITTAKEIVSKLVARIK